MDSTHNKKLYEILVLLKDNERNDLIDHLAFELGRSRLMTALSQHKVQGSSSLIDLIKGARTGRDSRLGYYNYQPIEEISKRLNKSASYVANMTKGRNNNLFHIEREIDQIRGTRTFFFYRVEPGYDIKTASDSVKFWEDMPRFTRRCVIRFAEEGVGVIRDSPSFTLEEFEVRFSAQHKEKFYQPYREALDAMVEAGEMSLLKDAGSGVGYMLQKNLRGTQRGCTIEPEDQSALWKKIQKMGVDDSLLS